MNSTSNHSKYDSNQGVRKITVPAREDAIDVKFSALDVISSG